MLGISVLGIVVAALVSGCALGAGESDEPTTADVQEPLSFSLTDRGPHERQIRSRSVPRRRRARGSRSGARSGA